MNCEWQCLFLKTVCFLYSISKTTFNFSKDEKVATQQKHGFGDAIVVPLWTSSLPRHKLESVFERSVSEAVLFLRRC